MLQKAQRRICIDPGHGGADPGAVGPTGYTEKEATLLTAHLVKQRLERIHYICMTRCNDEYLPVNQRAQLANSEEADLFVSIHANAFHSPAAHGTETLYFPGSDLGAEAAQEIQTALVLAIDLQDRGIKERGDLAVLRNTTMPAVLVELGFISNPHEEALLRDTDFLVSASCGIAQGILRYLST